jgi:hypothetical protein
MEHIAFFVFSNPHPVYRHIEGEGFGLRILFSIIFLMFLWMIYMCWKAGR